MSVDKAALHAQCLGLLKERVGRLIEAMDSAQQAANAETKSSAGDKYETSRAMMQEERDRLARQLAEVQKQLQLLEALPQSLQNERIAAGHLIETSIGWFYLAVSLGEIQLQDKKIMIISPVSPLAQALLNRKPGEQISFRGRPLSIKTFC